MLLPPYVEVSACGRNILIDLQLCNSISGMELSQGPQHKGSRRREPFCCALLVAVGVEGGQRAHPTAGDTSRFDFNMRQKREKSSQMCPPGGAFFARNRRPAGAGSRLHACVQLSATHVEPVRIQRHMDTEPIPLLVPETPRGEDGTHLPQEVGCTRHRRNIIFAPSVPYSVRWSH
jgi:hypothetical protein